MLPRRNPPLPNSCLCWAHTQTATHSVFRFLTTVAEGKHLNTSLFSMDIAYDHIQEDAFPDEDSAKQSTQPQPANLSAEFQEAYKVIASSPWGARLGGFFGSVKKQVGIYPRTSGHISNLPANLPCTHTNLAAERILLRWRPPGIQRSKLASYQRLHGITHLAPQPHARAVSQSTWLRRLSRRSLFHLLRR